MNYGHYGLAYGRLAKAVWESQARPKRWYIPGPERVTDAKSDDGVRETICLNGVWELAPGEAGGRHLAAGSPNVSRTCRTSRTGRLGTGPGSNCPRSGRGVLIQLEFLAVSAYSEVFVNGLYCGNNYYPASPFRVTINRGLRPGENWLYVFVHEFDVYTVAGIHGEKAILQPPQA